MSDSRKRPHNFNQWLVTSNSCSDNSDLELISVTDISEVLNTNENVTNSEVNRESNESNEMPSEIKSTSTQIPNSSSTTAPRKCYDQVNSGSSHTKASTSSAPKSNLKNVASQGQRAQVESTKESAKSNEKRIQIGSKRKHDESDDASKKAKNKTVNRGLGTMNEKRIQIGSKEKHKDSDDASKKAKRQGGSSIMNGEQNRRGSNEASDHGEQNFEFEDSVLDFDDMSAIGIDKLLATWNTKSESTLEIVSCYEDFRLSDRNQSVYTAKCKFCDGSAAPKSFMKGNNSNLRSHLKKVHKSEWDAIVAKLEGKKEAKLIEQQKLPPDKKTQIENAIVEFVVKERLPISKMDSVHLQKLIDVCLDRGKRNANSKKDTYLSGRKGRARITALAAEHKAELVETFKSVDYLSATSDVWSRSNKSFLAVSVHYYTKNMELKTSFIACELFEGRHTNDKVAAKLNEIFKRFGILEKVFFVTTDGAGEYTAAFKNYGDNYRSIELLNSYQDLEWFGGTAARSSDSDDEDNSDSEPEDEFVHRIDSRTDQMSADIQAEFQVHRIFEDRGDDTELPLLRNMNRIACSAHMLDKIGKNDSLKAKTDPTYDSIFERVFAKLKTIWDLKNSRLSSEIFTHYTQRKLVGPHRIRWMCTYDAIVNIRSIERTKLENFCDELQISKFDDDEYIFLEEYIEVIKPVAAALKTLEANKYTSGIYLPILVGLRSALNNLHEQNLMHCQPLIEAVEAGFERRFGNLMLIYNARSVPLYIAMVSNPRFKLNFLGYKQRVPRHIIEKVRSMLVSAAQEIRKQRSEKEEERQHGNSTQQPVVGNNALAP
ncbi:uncharacterized protein LOC129572896, partial [Sitodiplosis mosellana]|uniref:uncharacterized protein LOC129572896 n=1 Tax=Sitodiplosis mosellana TaxID=263140 RepID=UPI002444B440